jgi:adenylate kinase
MQGGIIMKIILTGPPGAGKGTMARFIEEEYHIPMISTGEILRREISIESELGKKVKDLMESGNFVPDEIVIGIIGEFLKDLKKGYILDGFPRNLNQAIKFDEMLEQQNSKLDCVVDIEVDDEVIIERVKGRLICPKCSRTYHVKYAKPLNSDFCDFCKVQLIRRVDDDEEHSRHRLEIYHKDTQPLLEYYQNKGIRNKVESSVDDIKQTHEKLEKILGEIVD